MIVLMSFFWFVVLDIIWGIIFFIAFFVPLILIVLGKMEGSDRLPW